MLRLIRAYFRGEYRNLSQDGLLTIIAAVSYLVDPFDLIPDEIPFLGFLDDFIAQVLKLFGALLTLFFQILKVGVGFFFIYRDGEPALVVRRNRQRGQICDASCRDE